MTFDLDDLKSGVKLGVMVGVAAVTLTLFMRPAATGSVPSVPVVATVKPAVTTTAGLPRAARTAAFGVHTPNADVRELADWIADTRDNGDGAFLLVDKRTAELHVFDADAHWLAATPVLLGAALGDDSVPGIGKRPMAAIRTPERTTPAGRFVGERGRNASGEDIVWVDYDAAVSLHRVRLTNPVERRAERLASPTAADNRISYGCINVPVAFYERHVQTVFAHHSANIYVLPDLKSMGDVFRGIPLPTRTAARSPAVTATTHVSPVSPVSHSPSQESP